MDVRRALPLLNCAQRRPTGGCAHGCRRSRGAARAWRTRSTACGQRWIDSPAMAIRDADQRKHRLASETWSCGQGVTRLPRRRARTTLDSVGRYDDEPRTSQGDRGLERGRELRRRSRLWNAGRTRLWSRRPKRTRGDAQASIAAGSRDPREDSATASERATLTGRRGAAPAQADRGPCRKCTARRPGKPQERRPWRRARRSGKNPEGGSPAQPRPRSHDGDAASGAVTPRGARLRAGDREGWPDTLKSLERRFVVVARRRSARLVPRGSSLVARPRTAAYT
jgi:hypothetical protein